MSIFLPEVIKDIIYSYVHQIKTEDIKNELISKIKICTRCDDKVIVHKKVNSHKCSCGQFICTNCYEEDLRDIENNNDNIRIIRCFCYNDWDQMTDDYDSIDEDWIWQDMYGIASMSQIY
jgi:hypothetical protein